MTEPQPQNPTPDPQGAKPWANPMDAPPPFPNAGPAYRSSNPYSFDPSASTHASPQSWTPGGQLAGRRPTGDDRLWAMLAHLSSPIAAIVSGGWLTIAGPLVVYLAKKDSSAFARNAAAGAFNFTISMWLMSLVGWILTITVIGAIIGIPMILIGTFGSIVLGLVGAIKTWNGEAYTYPWQVKILS
ncbi:MAG: DUF4870 domain-containing protein [Actinomycetes bacterium]